jgi:hypothetical protein
VSIVLAFVTDEHSEHEGRVSEKVPAALHTQYYPIYYNKIYNL